MLSVEGHQMHIVSTDGAPIKETLADFLVIYPGERYDFTIIGKCKSCLSKPVYYVMAQSLERYTAKGRIVDKTFGLARIHYKRTLPVNDTGNLPDFSVA